MPGVTITATFGKKEAERNGLAAISKELVEEHPPARHYVVGVIECLRYEVDRASGDVRTPAVKFVAIEAALTESDVKELKAVFERRYMDRTGRGETLDFAAGVDDDDPEDD